MLRAEVFVLVFSPNHVIYWYLHYMCSTCMCLQIWVGHDGDYFWAVQQWYDVSWDKKKMGLSVLWWSAWSVLLWKRRGSITMRPHAHQRPRAAASINLHSVSVLHSAYRPCWWLQPPVLLLFCAAVISCSTFISFASETETFQSSKINRTPRCLCFCYWIII